MLNKINHKKNSGFTIIELMIATLVFSVVLMVGTSLIVQLGRMYYKGMSMSRTQNSARVIIEDITRNVQYSGENNDYSIDTSPTDLVSGQRVIGNYCYDFDTSINNNNKFRRYNSESCAGTDYVDLLGDDIKLVKLTVDGLSDGATPNPVLINVGLVYAAGGDSNLYQWDNSINQYQCKSIYNSSQWCASSYLSTTVYRRA